jgi:hypothetical protein
VVTSIGVLISGAWVAWAAQAADTGDKQPDPSTEDSAAVDAALRHAEYIRLSQELEKLAQRNAWAGVERTYRQLVATGVAPTFDDFFIGAQGARAIGDVTSARQRLLAANALKEDREILDWLWEIDSNYGQVFLAADVGSCEFRPEAMPFAVDHAAAVEFARQQIEKSGGFDGFLPQGKYYFGTYEVVVRPRVSATRIDVRTDGGMKGPKKRKVLSDR